MNLLLVDDEQYVVESIKKNINLKKCGITEVYTAYSMGQAQQIIDLMSVDIIISDIVMPGKTGFDLVEWVRERNNQVQVIFLTSYAEFDYAKRAIALDSVEYLLKPIDFEQLEKALTVAVDRAKQRNRYYKDEQRWKRNRQVIVREFWKEVLTENIRGTEFENEARKRHLPYEEKFQGKLLYLSFYISSCCKSIWDKKIINFIVENVLGEMFEKTNVILETVIPKGENGCIVICRKQEGEDETGKILEEFVHWINEKIQLELWCGIGEWESAIEFPHSLEKLYIMQDNSMSQRNKVLSLSDFQQTETSYQNPNRKVWEALLKEENEEDLLKHMEKYLRGIEEAQLMTRKILKDFRMDVMQIVYSWLEKEQIEAYLLFSTKENEIYYQNALNSVQGAVEYASNLVKKAISYRKYVNKTESVTEQICKYIDVHYREEIRREELGKMVYLNADYLSRTFKKELGISISTYILQKRVDEAKKLLKQSNLPINTVSLSVGYSNFSYFTKMFKENTGYAPLEYRRKCNNEMEKKE